MTVTERMLRLIAAQGPWSTLGKTAAAIVEQDRKIEALARSIIRKEH